MSGLWGGIWIVACYRKRLRDYVNFSHESPGPGVRLNSAEERHVTLKPVTGANAPALEADTQAGTHRQLERLQTRLGSYYWPAVSISIVVTVLYFGALIDKILCR